MSDLATPFPDRGHEALRVELMAAVEAGRGNTAGVDDAYFLTDLIFSLLNGVSASVDALTARVTALEPPPVPPPAPGG